MAGVNASRDKYRDPTGHLPEGPAKRSQERFPNRTAAVWGLPPNYRSCRDVTLLLHNTHSSHPETWPTLCDPSEMSCLGCTRTFHEAAASPVSPRNAQSHGPVLLAGMSSMPFAVGIH
ncbi:hypothetical protein CPLU01_13387 [Colletotrichum plurivorum]|uniref:Uncharacterized protein n=1 Tax=Colletotrichum plurivorum TaxID=2175906 RepID=A0A8H6JRU2_9PEZI|nr:hypothetical protein CPLU01_13387 [Colletotrichum plurivorum]